MEIQVAWVQIGFGPRELTGWREMDLIHFVSFDDLLVIGNFGLRV